MSNDPRGTIVQQGLTMRVDNALIEEASCFNQSNGYIIISHAVPGPNNLVSIQTIRLNINRDTVVLNSFGQRINVCNLRRGSWVNAVFSSRMTRSIPPQSNALLIVIQRAQRPAPAAPTSTTTARIASVEPQNKFVYTGNPNNINTQTRFVVTDTTIILNRNGIPISIYALRPGQSVRITHANYMTASIPPQTTAFRIQVL